MATTHWDMLGHALATRGIPSDVEERWSGDYDADPWRPPPRSGVVRITLTPEDAGRLVDLVRDRESEGVWIAYVLDWNAVPKAVFNDELLARRYAADNYCEVRFWRFGIEWNADGAHDSEAAE